MAKRNKWYEMTYEELDELQNEKGKQINDLLSENCVRYNRMKDIAYNFFIDGSMTEREACAEYKELYKSAQATHVRIFELRNDVHDLSDRKMELSGAGIK